MGQRELERGRGVTQSEYVSELDGSGDGACVVGDEILGGAPLGKRTIPNKCRHRGKRQAVYVAM